MSSTAQHLADLVGGTVEGNGIVVIAAARSLNEAGPGDITFADSSDRNRIAFEGCSASAFVVGRTEPACAKTLIRVDDPFEAFLTIALHLEPPIATALAGIDARACVDPSATLGSECDIRAFASVGAGSVLGLRCQLHRGVVVGRNCRLGDDVALHPNVVLYDNTVLGNRVVVHANSVIGADGFGYRFRDGRHIKTPQLGRVEIDDDVEIGACTTIDRATFGATRIGQGTKIDNQVQIGHNCRLGRHNVLVAQIGMAGSCSTGDYVTMAGQVGIRDHVHIGDRSTLGAKAAIMKDVPAGSKMLGAPATPEQDQKRMLIALAGLPELRKTVSRILRHLGIASSGEDRLPTTEAA